MKNTQMEDKTLVVYVPGFGSKGENSQNFKALKKQTEFNSHCLTYDNHDPVIAFKQIDEQLRNLYMNVNWDIVLLGSSLGGYWANMFSQKWHFPCILVNPAIDPNDIMKLINVVPINKYVDTTTKPASRVIFVGMDDKIAPPQKTIDTFNAIAEIITLKEGHSLKDFKPVIERLKKYINNIQEV